MKPVVSVVVATYNRAASVARLLQQLAEQSLPPFLFEVVVVDDSSDEPVGPALGALALPYRLQLERVPRGGAGAARHRGAELATGEILVVLDDDMQVGKDFLAAHLLRHRTHARAVVLGRIAADPGLAAMPPFERYHARQLERARKALLDGAVPRGVQLCTGNVSFRRADYFAVGGFDGGLARSEDRELGVRLETAGCVFVYADDAASVHSSDHADPTVWRRRAYLYGRFDHKIWAKHRQRREIHPWKFFGKIHPAARPLVRLTVALPRVGEALARTALWGALRLDRVGLCAPAVHGAAIAYALEYFRGLREEVGSRRALRREIRDLRRAAEDEACGRAGALRRFFAAVRADHDQMRFYRNKYHGQKMGRARLPLDLFRKVGFQMMTTYRLMRVLDEARVPLAPSLVSRAIRHLFGAEIHWKTRIEPGVSIVHGNGLVLSHLARIGSGCILFHNVTLGEGRDGATGETGAPRLERNVHVAPGAVLLGPITVGEGTKVMPTALLTRSVPAQSLVSVREAEVVERTRRPRIAA